MTQNGLSVRDSFVAAFEILQQKLNGKNIAVPEEPSAYYPVVCKKLMILVVEGTEWAIALRTIRQRGYDSDIAAVSISSGGISEEQLQKNIYKAFEDNPKNAIIIATDEGKINFYMRSFFIEEVKKAFPSGGVPKEFILQSAEYAKGYLQADTSPIIRSGQRYTEKFPSYLSGRIQEVLLLQQKK